MVGVSGGQCCVTVILRHSQGSEGWAHPHLCQQRDGEGCLFVCFLYLPCCVIAEYPKEEGWTHTCVSRGMERDVYLFVFCTCHVVL